MNGRSKHVCIRNGVKTGTIDLTLLRDPPELRRFKDYIPQLFEWEAI